MALKEGAWERLADRLGITVEEVKERGLAAQVRHEAEQAAAIQEAAATIKLTPAQRTLLGKVAASEYGLNRPNQDAIYHALMRLAKRGLVDDTLNAGVKSYNFTLTDLGRAVVEVQA